jgi:FkbM family methyltransferase
MQILHEPPEYLSSNEMMRQEAGSLHRQGFGHESVPLAGIRSENPIRAITKMLALHLLPDSILHFVKKVHYTRVLRRITESVEPDLKVVNYLVEPGQCAVDIGANIGVYSKFLSQRTGLSGRVISVEPVPATFDILRSNVRKLGLRNVELINCAISDTPGQARMKVPKYDSGGENFYQAQIYGGEFDSSVRTFMVPTITIDELYSTVPGIDFIKVDVEGHELNCVRGAAKTIERCKPAWLIEISGDMGDKRSRSYQTYRILSDGGYHAYWFDGTKLKPWRPDTRSVNYFFLTPTQLESLRQRGGLFESS